MTTLISLIGEQPLPNLLPIRALKPKRVALMHTASTHAVAQRLKRLIDAPVDFIDVKPYDVRDGQQKLKHYLQKTSGPMVYNLTGGTKMMSLATYTVAVSNRSAVVYLQTQGNRSRLYTYRVSSSGLIESGASELPVLITADDYLCAHVAGYTCTGFSQEGGKLSAGGLFEKAVNDVLAGQADEVLVGVHPDGVAGNIDIDFLIRCGNQVGIVEAKAHKASKDGLDQLMMAGGREYLGTYAAKFLVVGNTIGSSLKQLAQARDITTIELPSYAATGALSGSDAKLLIETIRAKLGAFNR
jgi:hypothetical protein